MQALTGSARNQSAPALFALAYREVGPGRPHQSRLRSQAAGDSKRLQRTQAVNEARGNRHVAADRDGGI